MTERRREGLKWSSFPEEVIPAWVAEMDYQLAPGIAAALHDAVDKGLVGYPYPEAEEATAQAAVDFWRDELDWVVDPTWVYPAPDVIEGVRRAIEHLTRPGSPVVLHTPVYFPFFSMIEKAGRDLIEVPCSPALDGRYSLNLDGIDSALEAGAGSVVLCNPWNPTGRVFDGEELHDLIDVVRRHEGRLISDEIHGPITYPEVTHIPAATIDAEVVVTVTSASKTWDIPGLKCAQVVLTDSTDRDIWDRYFTPDKVGVGTFGLIASTAAYSDARDWHHDTMRRLTVNRDTFSSLMTNKLPRVGTRAIEGTYLAWLDFSAYPLHDPTEFLLSEANVALTAGGPFGRGQAPFARLNLATSEELLVQIVERMTSALDGIA